MPILVSCSCGQRFSAKDSLGGTTVRCPSCGGPLAIPPSQPLVTSQPPPSPPLSPLPSTAYSGGRRRRPRPSNPFPAIAAIVGGVFLLLMLICGGAAWGIYLGVKQAATELAEELDLESSEMEEWIDIARTAANRQPTATLPSGPLVYQPMFKWKSGDTSFQGTGFLMRTPQGETVAMTSAHFIDFYGDPLLEARWLDVATLEPVVTLTHQYGVRGRGIGSGGANGKPSLTSDYFMLAGASNIDAGNRAVLELDPRKTVDIGERVWLPNKDETAANGYVALEGTVVEAEQSYTTILFDNRFELQSQSGSPLISQQTGKVIGLLSLGGEYRERSWINIAPSWSPLHYLEMASRRMPLEETFGGRRPIRRPGP